MTTLLDHAIQKYPQHEEGAWWVPRSYGGSAPAREDAANDRASRGAGSSGAATGRAAGHTA